MGHFAHTVPIENSDLLRVDNVIVADQAFIDERPCPADWVQTSYNTFAGVHKLGGTPLRKNYAGVGYIYDKSREAFYLPQPFPSWSLDEETCQWQPPIPQPLEGVTRWDEDTLSWIPVV